MIPIRVLFPAYRGINGFEILKQMRKGVEESCLALLIYAEAKPERSLNRHARVTEVFVVENLRGISFTVRAILAHDLLDVILAKIPALVAHAAAHRLPARARINE